MSGELEQGSSKEAGVAGTGGRSNRVVKVRKVSSVATFGNSKKVCQKNIKQ